MLRSWTANFARNAAFTAACIIGFGLKVLLAVTAVMTVVYTLNVMTGN